MSSGDGHTAPVSPPETPRPPDPEGGAEAVQRAVLAELQKQTKLMEENRTLLHRLLLGDVDQLDAADVMAALGCGEKKLQALVDDGQIPMYRLAEGGPRRIGRDTFKAVIRKWADMARK